MYTAITEDTLSVIKAPPLYAPVLTGTRDDDNSSNNIGTNIFQFRARFEYDDNEKSVWGPISVVNTMTNKFTAYGYGTPDLVSNNLINIAIVIPDDTTLIKMSIAMRKNNVGDWYIVDTVDVGAYRGVTYTYHFYNDKLTYAIAPSDAARPYDYVPKLAGSQEVVGESYLVYGDLIEGYNNKTELDVNFTYAATSRNPVGADIDLFRLNPLRFVTVDILNYLDLGNDVGGSIEIVVSGGGVANVYSFPHFYHWDTTTNTKAANAANYFANVVAQMQNDNLLESVWYGIYSETGANELHFRFHNWVDDANISVSCFSDIPIHRTLKDGAKHYFGIVYSDRYGRLASVRRNADTEFYIPFPTETGETYYDNTYNLNYTINHKPPAWAHSWRIVYGGCNIDWFQQFVLRTHSYTDQTIWRENGRMKIKINQSINDLRNYVENYHIPNYLWQEGDRLRIIGTRETSDTTNQHGKKFSLISDYVDLEVLYFDGIYIYTHDWFNYASAPNIDNTTDDILVEIYRPKPKSDNTVYYGVGKTYSITNPEESSRSHASSTGSVGIAGCYMYAGPLSLLVKSIDLEAGATTSSTTTTSTTTNERQDHVKPYGLSVGLIQSLYQTPFVSDSNQYDTGELHIIDENYKETHNQNLRWSGQFVTQTNINNTNRFEYDDYLVMNAKFGVIAKLIEIGYTLKVLQRNKITSIYVGREMSLDANGNEQLVYTNNVLGTQRPAATNYGTEYKMAVVNSERYLYFIDLNTAKVLRDSPNGQEEISEYGMDTYLREKVTEILASGESNLTIIAGHDRENDLILFTVVDASDSSNNATIGFHETSNKWISFYSFVPHFYASIGKRVFLSAYGNVPDVSLYKHNSDSVNRCTFYGTGYDTRIKLVHNANAQVIKQYESLEVASNQAWSAYQYIDEDEGYPREMVSVVAYGEFVNHEGSYRAPFNKDMYSDGSGVANAYQLHNGRALRGRAMVLYLVRTLTTEANLFFVRVKSLLSR